MIDTITKLYEVTNGGLSIMTDVYPVIESVVTNNKKAFRLRPNERTPSAYLYPPKDGSDCWHVVDYGMCEGERRFSPIDLYMWGRGLRQDQFPRALEELKEKYGVSDTLSRSVNKPEIEQREARPDEIGAQPRVTTKDNFDGIDLKVWGPLVKPEHLEQLGWKAVASVATTKDNKTTIRMATPTYPIFVQRCEYTDKAGNQQVFLKVYEPNNPDKKFRFRFIGKIPDGNYIFGLSALRRKFCERNEKKLDEVLLVSGGSDAANALSMGYQPVWLNSETEALTEEMLDTLMRYAKRVVSIPDIDITGKKAGTRLALQYPQIYTAWLNQNDMGNLHDNRGRKCKDLKDYIRLNPTPKAMKLLIDRAKRAQFWDEHTDKDGNKHYDLSRTMLDYFLELNGFAMLRTNTCREPVYIRIDGVKVKHVNAMDIMNYIKMWCEEKGLPEPLQNKILRSRDLPTPQSSSLRIIDGLDFSKATAKSQFFYFRNCWVEVTETDITTHRYSEETGRYVWAENTIPHNYRQLPKMFDVTKDDKGHWIVNPAEGRSMSPLLSFITNTSRIHWRKEDEHGQQLSPEEQWEEYQCLVSKFAAIGYLLHSYKSESSAWAIICQDAKVGNTVNECNGRSGKSFFLRAVGKCIKVFQIDARLANVTDNRFLFDGVTEDTDLVVVDECHQNLTLDSFYGRITGDFCVEGKGKHPVQIPFTRSPKLAFATNYVLKHHNPSTEGRFWPQVFGDYYHVKTPQNDYKETRTIYNDLDLNLMGSEYLEELWEADYCFMLQCLQFYLSLRAEERKIMPPMRHIEQREQMAAVGDVFKEWADEMLAPGSSLLDCEIKAEEMLNQFNNETRYQWSPKNFTKHLKDYCQCADHIECLNPASITNKQKDGERWVKRDKTGRQVNCYYIKSVAQSSE